jgi:hypothetical protein
VFLRQAFLCHFSAVISITFKAIKRVPQDAFFFLLLFGYALVSSKVGIFSLSSWCVPVMSQPCSLTPNSFFELHWELVECNRKIIFTSDEHDQSKNEKMLIASNHLKVFLNFTVNFCLLAYSP